MPDPDGTIDALLDSAVAAAEAVATAPSVGHVLNDMFEAAVAPTLQQPTFVLDFPIEVSPLAKPHWPSASIQEVVAFPLM